MMDRAGSRVEQRVDRRVESRVGKRAIIGRVLLFTILVNVLAWLGPLLGGGPSAPGMGLLVWGTAPIVSALLLQAVFRDWGDFGLRPGFRRNMPWYWLSLLSYPVVILCVIGLGVVFGITTIQDFAVPELIAAMVPLMVIYFFFALFEEAGWRGYLAPKVYALRDDLWGHALVGVIWASWHFPYLRELWAHTSESLITLVPRFVLGTIVLSVVYGEIRIRTGTFWPAVLMHWVGNTIANTLLVGFAGAGVIAFARGKEYLGSFGAEGVGPILLLGMLGLFLYTRRRQAR